MKISLGEVGIESTDHYCSFVRQGIGYREAVVVLHPETRRGGVNALMGDAEAPTNNHLAKGKKTNGKKG
mgnify:CR=1 FL=1|tara:strand:+ start:151 stop:357 length:207 start_codon:yes stop_codon:yes gene_type:complete